MIGDLAWTQNGGAGYAFTRADVLSMTYEEMKFQIERQTERRKAEARARKGAPSGM